MKLSIAMMVKNEEKYLEQCLSSLKPIMDAISSELIIVDTGSEDRTVDIAKKHTDKVYFHEWNNDFAGMRNKTIEYTKGEWILILDGDEIIESPQGIISFLNSKRSKNNNTGTLTIKNIMAADDESMFSSFFALRLFRNNNFRFEGLIHEQPKYKHPIAEIDSQILHYGYLSTDKDLMEYKFQRNTKLLKDELEKDPENIYYWFQLSKSYGAYREYKKSLDANIKAYDIARKNKVDLKNRMYIYVHLALAYFMNERYVEQERTCLEAIRLKEGYLDIYYFLAISQKKLGKHKEAIKAYELYLKLLSQNNYVKGISTVNNTVGRYEYAYLDLCEMYSLQGNKEKALDYANMITSKNLVKLAILHIVKIYIYLKRYNELKKYYTELEEDRELIFWTSLENAIKDLEKDEKQKIIRLFSEGNCNYSLLNKVRIYLEQEDNKLDDSILSQIKDLDFNSLPVFFGDIIYFYLKNNLSLLIPLKSVREHTLQSYIDFLLKKYDGLSEIMINYLKKNEFHKSLSEVKLRKVLEKGILILDETDSEQLKSVWNRYIEDGTYYITNVYNHQVIENEMIYDVKSDEDAFLVYMVLAKRIKEKSQLEYVKYLRKALKIYPKMKKGIEVLMNEMKLENDEDSSNNESNEFEELKESVKKNIQILLDSEQTAEAKQVIDEYLKIVPDDMEMLVLKSEILLAAT